MILVSQPLGRLLARVLPDWTVPLGRFSFSLNPGPFSIKEHAIIGIAANSGSQGQWASKFCETSGFSPCPTKSHEIHVLTKTASVCVAYLPTNAALYYGITMSPAVALFFGWVSGSGEAFQICLRM